MALTVNGAAGNPVTSLPLLDLSEDIEGMMAQPAGGGAGTSTGISCASRGTPTQFASTTPVRYIYAAAVGTAPTLVYDALIGRTIIRHTSAAGIIGRVALSTSANAVRIPAQVLWSQATSIPATYLRPLRSYTLYNIARVSALAGGNAFLGISDGGAGVGGNMPFSSCAGWVADSTINGGRWTARHRQVSGGAITTDYDSGIAASATWIQLGLRYTEGPTPTLEWLVNDVPVFVLSGDANMLTLTSFLNGFYPDARTLAGVGTVMDTGPARFVVEEVT